MAECDIENSDDDNNISFMSGEDNSLSSLEISDCTVDSDKNNCNESISEDMELIPVVDISLSNEENNMQSLENDSTENSNVAYGLDSQPLQIFQINGKGEVICVDDTENSSLLYLNEEVDLPVLNGITDWHASEIKENNNVLVSKSSEVSAFPHSPISEAVPLKLIDSNRTDSAVQLCNKPIPVTSCNVVSKLTAQRQNLTNSLKKGTAAVTIKRSRKTKSTELTDETYIKELRNAKNSSARKTPPAKKRKVSAEIKNTNQQMTSVNLQVCSYPPYMCPPPAMNNQSIPMLNAPYPFYPMNNFGYPVPVFPPVPANTLHYYPDMSSNYYQSQGALDFSSSNYLLKK